MIGKGPHGGPMPERLQCPVLSPRSSIQCVMEEGHEPLGKGPDGTPLVHNFGGIGPYTPGIDPDRPVAEGPVRCWAYGGAVLNGDDKGCVSLADLKAFVSAVEDLNKGAPEPVKISIHPYSLRATRVEGDGGPHLDWRDDD